MKSFKTLIKLANSQIDEIRKELNALLEQQEMFKKQRSDIQDYVKKETEYVMVNPDAKQSYDIFILGMNIKLENTRQAIERYDQMIEPLQNKMADAFADLKKYEILLERKEKELADEIKHKEQLAMDEIGIAGYLRKEKERNENA